MASVAEFFRGKADREWQSDVAINAGSGLRYGKLRVCTVNNCCREAHHFSGLTQTGKFESGLRADLYSSMAYLANFVTGEWVLKTAGHSARQVFLTPHERARDVRLKDGDIILSAAKQCERNNAERNCKRVTSSSC